MAFPSQGTDESFGDFEKAIIQSVAWTNEIPPEILCLAFNSNYSASQAALQEFNMYLHRVRTRFGHDFCQPVYEEWLLSEVLAQGVDAPGLLEAWRDPARYAELGGWTMAEWSGHIKPSTDVFKQARGAEKLLALGITTRDRLAREIGAGKYSKIVKQRAREDRMLAEAIAPMVELEKHGVRPGSEDGSGSRRSHLRVIPGGAGRRREDDDLDDEDDDEEREQ